MDTIQKQLLKALNKARTHQEDHPLSTSANREVKLAESALAVYISDISFTDNNPNSYNSDMDGSYLNLGQH